MAFNQWLRLFFVGRFRPIALIRLGLILWLLGFGSHHPIGQSAFKDCTTLQSVSLLGVVTGCGARAFADDAALSSLNYAGTMEQFKAMTKDETRNQNCGVLKSVVCADDSVTL